MFCAFFFCNKCKKILKKRIRRDIIKYNCIYFLKIGLFDAGKGAQDGNNY